MIAGAFEIIDRRSTSVPDATGEPMTMGASTGETLASCSRGRPRVAAAAGASGDTPRVPLVEGARLPTISGSKAG